MRRTAVIVVLASVALAACGAEKPAENQAAQAALEVPVSTGPAPAAVPAPVTTVTAAKPAAAPRPAAAKPAAVVTTTTRPAPAPITSTTTMTVVTPTTEPVAETTTTTGPAAARECAVTVSDPAPTYGAPQTVTVTSNQPGGRFRLEVSYVQFGKPNTRLTYEHTADALGGFTQTFTVMGKSTLPANVRVWPYNELGDLLLDEGCSTTFASPAP